MNLISGKISIKTCTLLLFLLIILFDNNITFGQIKLDSYGGWIDVKATKTGWFHIEEINGRFLLITPEGHGFIALGVNHLSEIRKNGPKEPNLFMTLYNNDWNKFAEDLGNQYEDWEYNTVDDSVDPLMKKYPHFTSRNFVATSKYLKNKVTDGKPYNFPDIFDSLVKKQLEQDVAEFCKKYRDDANLIAYYWTDTPTWDIHKTRKFRGTDWVSEIRRLPGNAPGRLKYASFLQERYKTDINWFNRAYGLKLDSFKQLESIDFSNLDLSRYEVEHDDQDFLGIIARTYYGIVGTAMRKNDRNHMIFGEKYLLGDIPRQVLEAALPYIDAIAVQPGDGYLPIYTPGDIYPGKEIESLHKISDKPIMICDHQIGFSTEKYSKSIWPYHLRESEVEAAIATEQFILEAFKQSYIIGYMRCMYIDRFTKRRNAIKIGLLHDDGTIRTQLVDATRKANQKVNESVRNFVKQK